MRKITRWMIPTTEDGRPAWEMTTHEQVQLVLVPMCRMTCTMYLLIFHVSLGMVWVLAFHVPTLDPFRFNQDWYVTRGRRLHTDGVDRLWSMHQGGAYLTLGIAMVHEATGFARTGQGNGSIWLAVMLYHMYVIYGLTVVYPTRMAFLSADGEQATLLFHAACAIASFTMLATQSYVIPLFTPYPSPSPASPILLDTPPHELPPQSRSADSPEQQRSSGSRTNKSRSPGRKEKQKVK